MSFKVSLKDFGHGFGRWNVYHDSLHLGALLSGLLALPNERSKWMLNGFLKSFHQTQKAQAAGSSNLLKNLAYTELAGNKYEDKYG